VDGSLGEQTGEQTSEQTDKHADEHADAKYGDASMSDTNLPDANTSGPQVPTPKPRSWLVVSLIISLAINLLFIGVLAGKLASRPHSGPMPRHLGWMLRDLDPSIRQQLRPQMQAHAEQVRPLRLSLRQAQRNLRSVLATDPLDEDGLAAALSQLQKASSGLQLSMHKEMITLAKQLGPEQRTRIAHFLRSPERGERHRPDGGPQP
jgi:uncharacterized membrane protein